MASKDFESGPAFDQFYDIEQPLRQRVPRGSALRRSGRFQALVY